MLELDRNMIQYLAPSISAYLESMSLDDRAEWLAGCLSSNVERRDGVTEGWPHEKWVDDINFGMGLEFAILHLAADAERIGDTTADGSRFYVTENWSETVPFCTFEQMLDYWS